MKTATFNVAMADAEYPAGTPTPTTVRARAEGAAGSKTATTLWEPSGTALNIPMTFDELTEAGAWQGFADLLAGATVLKTFGPTPFMVPAGPTTVTYRSPSGLTITVG